MVKTGELVGEYCPHCDEETYHYYEERRGWVCVSCNRTGSERESGCLISTVVCTTTGLGSNCRELRMLREFRDSYMMETGRRRRLVMEYYRDGPVIVRSLVRSPRKKRICEMLYGRFILRALGHIESHEYEKALGKYTEMVDFLQKELADDRR